jgi:AraC-like DNA-binding protein
MSKQIESSLFIASSLPALYQHLLSGIGSYEELATRILVQIKSAHAFRQTDKVRELARILVNLPLSEARLIGQFYLAWCDCRTRHYRAAVLESIVDQSRIYKAQALISRAAIEFYQGNLDDALRFYLESLRARPTASEYALAVKGIAVIKSIEGFPAQALRDLSNLTTILRYAEPVAYFDCLNSYAVELSKAGQLDDARSVSNLVLTSPFASAYPEWQETLSEIRAKRKQRSIIALSRPEIEQKYDAQSEAPENVIGKARVRTVINFMSANLHRRMSLNELASVVNLSRSGFSRLFKTETGVSPGEYLIRLKMERACQLLEATTFLSIKQIMAEVGYYNKGNFVRQFKRYFYITPSEYRKRAFTSA